jgi:hypothetical protein
MDFYRVEVDDALQAFEEWQVSVEERLAEVRHAVGFDRAGVAVPIADPGPSKYDREPDAGTE